MVPISAYVVLASVLFILGGAGVLLRRSPLVTLMSIELMWNSANLLLVAFSRQFGSHDGQVFAFLVMVVAAAEVAIGLALVVLVFRRLQRVDLDDVHTLSG